MEIAPGLHRIDTPLGTRVSSLYLIVGQTGALLFDSGVAGTIPDRLLPYLAAHQMDPSGIRWVVISHCDVDHFGGIADVRAHLPGAVIVAHDADADAMADYSVYEHDRARGFRVPYGLDEDPAVLSWARSVTGEGPVDVRLKGEITIDLGHRRVEVLHVPGHTRGHLALLDTGTRAALVSDAVLGVAVPNVDGTPAFPPTYRHLRDYRATITRLHRIAPAWLLTAHYPTFKGPDVARFLDQSAEFTARLENEVLAALRHDSATLAQLLDQLNHAGRVNRVGGWTPEGTAGALAFPVAAHVEDLIDRGLVAVAARTGAGVLLAATT